MAIIIMGVSGCGKTTVGQIISQACDRTFVDADDLHSAEAIDKMYRGIPLTDSDRAPWLHCINETLHQHNNTVLACSALKHNYRKIISNGVPCWFVYLAISYDDAYQRLSTRTHHFFNPQLLQSQYDALEPLRETEPGITLPATIDIDILREKIYHELEIVMRQIPNI